MVDAGLPGRTIEAALSFVGVSPQTLTGILVTHEHIDHTRGIGVLSRRFDLPVYANAGTWEGMQADVGPVALRNMRMFETGREFYAEKLLIQSFPTPHDARESVGYSFAAEDRRASVMTDIGYVPEALLDAVGKSDLLLIESNHDEEMLKVGPYPYPLKRRILGDQGHLSNENCGKTLCKLYKRGVRCAILGHLSKENNYEQLALETVRSELRCEDIPDDAFQLTVAHRDRITGVFVL